MHERGGDLDTVDESIDSQSQRSLDGDDGGSGAVSLPSSPQRQAAGGFTASSSAPTTPAGSVGSRSPGRGAGRGGGGLLFREDGSVGESVGDSVVDGDTDVSDRLLGARVLLARLKHTSIDKVWRTVLEGALLEARGGEVSEQCQRDRPQVRLTRTTTALQFSLFLSVCSLSRFTPLSPRRLLAISLNGAPLLPPPPPPPPPPFALSAPAPCR